MSELSQKLREALEAAKAQPVVPGWVETEVLLSQETAATLLTEHEKLEREAEAGKALAKTLEGLEDNPAILDHTGWYSLEEVDAAVAAYRTACGEASSIQREDPKKNSSQEI